MTFNSSMTAGEKMMAIILVTLIVLVLWPVATITNASPAQAFECRGVALSTTFQTNRHPSFSGHLVRTTAEVCRLAYGPGRLQAVSKPVVSFPSRNPVFSTFEALSLGTEPYLVKRNQFRIVYEFTVQQKVFKLFSGSTFSFRAVYGENASRLCMDGTCTDWKRYR